MNVIVRVVASLIATLVLSFGSASAGPVKGENVSGSNSKKAAPNVNVYRTEDGRYTLSPTGGEPAFSAYRPNTWGMMNARVNLDGTITMPAGKRLVSNPNFSVGRMIYNPLTGTLAPTGTRKLIEVVAPIGDQFGGHYLVGVTTSYAKAEELVASVPGSFVSDYGWSVPAEVKSVWLTNNPADRVYDSVLQETFGSFVSRFDLTMGGVRQDFWTQQAQRRIEFDQSRLTAFTPARAFATLQAKSVVTPIATDSLSRIAVVPYEPNGKLIHMGGNASSGRIWFFDPKTNTSDFGFFGPDLVGEANLQILVVGRALFRVVGVNNFTTTKVYVYNLDTGVQQGSSWSLPFKTGQGSESAAYRPELAFSPSEGRLYIAAPEVGKLYWLNVTSGSHAEVVIPQANGIAYGASDVEVDTARNAVYVVAMGWNGSWRSGSLTNGKVFEYPVGATVSSRSVEVGKGPWQAVLSASEGVNTLFITNSADDLAPVDTMSEVETIGFTQVRKLPTLEQPTGIVVQLK